MTDTASSVATVVEPPHAGSKARLRLISQDQYFNTLTYIFGADIRVSAQFDPLRRTDGLLASGAATAGVTVGGIQRFQQAAAAVSKLVVDAAHREYLIPCKPGSASLPDDVCAAKFLKQTGRLLYRRPVSDAKLAEFVSEARDSATRLGDFYAGLAVALEGMLVSPNFLFITDIVEDDPTAAGRKRLDAYSLASRLSFFLWNAAPDDALLSAAERGALQTPEGRARAVDAMLASPRLQAGVRAFFDDMFAFDDIDNLAKDPTVYPAFTPTTAMDSREQTLRTVVDHLVARNLDYRDLFVTRSTFISPALAVAYQIGTASPGWRPYEFPEGSVRAGLLTQISFLATHSHPVRSSPTLRGKALRELLLCQKVPPPPPNVDFSLVEDPKANHRTARERLDAHRSTPACAGCHKITDPMGLALENFDGAGRYRQTEDGAPIDVSGSLDGQAFTDVAGLGKALRNHPALPSCLVKRVYDYGTGGPTTAVAKPLLKHFENEFKAQGYKVPALLRAIALSAAFSKTGEPTAAAVKAENAPSNRQRQIW